METVVRNRKPIFACVGGAWRLECFADGLTPARQLAILAKIIEKNGPGTAYITWLPDPTDSLSLSQPTMAERYPDRRQCCNSMRGSGHTGDCIYAAQLESKSLIDAWNVCCGTRAGLDHMPTCEKASALPPSRSILGHVAQYFADKPIGHSARISAIALYKSSLYPDGDAAMGSVSLAVARYGNKIGVAPVNVEGHRGAIKLAETVVPEPVVTEPVVDIKSIPRCQQQVLVPGNLVKQACMRLLPEASPCPDSRLHI